MYAAIVDPAGTIVVHSDVTEQGRELPPRSDLEALLHWGWAARLRALYSDQARIVEVQQPIEIVRSGRSELFGTIRVGIPTLLVRAAIDEALGQALVALALALVVSVAIALVLAQVMLRPIHVIKSGLTKLGRGEFGVKLDVPQTDEFGELGSFFNAVSAQLSADRSQRASQQSAVEHLEDAVALFNPDGELLFANPPMRTTLPPDPHGRPIDDLLPAEHPYRRLVQETIATKESRGPMPVARDWAWDEASASLPGRRGSEELVMTHAIKDVGGRLVGAMLVARDLEYLGRVHSTIAYSRKLAALGRLSAGVAHEVKNPLNAMTIHLELLKQKLLAALPERGRPAPEAANPRAAPPVATGAAPPLDVASTLDHVTVIANEIRRLDQVVQGFLKFTRPEDVRLQPIALAALLDRLRPLIEPEAQKSGVVLQTHCPADLPDINGDPAMLTQALLNLALNACQAMPNGGTLRIGCTRSSRRRVELTVEDTGAGIRPEHLQRIFDLYFTRPRRAAAASASPWCTASSSSTTARLR